MYGLSMKLPATTVLDKAEDVLPYLRVLAAFSGAPGIVQGGISLLEKVLKFPAVKPFVAEQMRKSGYFTATGPGKNEEWPKELEQAGITRQDVQAGTLLFGCDQCDDEAPN